MVRRIRLLLATVLGIAILLAAPPPAAAEHTPHHRYFITGTITDNLGQPLCGILVRAADVTDSMPDGSDNRTATTDGSGVYTIQLHMHDGDTTDGATPSEQGHTIHVEIAGTSVMRMVLATANAGNPSGWGQQSGVDLTAPAGTRDQCGLGPVLIVAGVGGGVAFMVLAVVWVRRRPRGVGKGSQKALLAVPGITRVRAREIGSFGIRSVKELAEADPAELSSKTNMSAKEARLVVKRAKEFVGQRGAD